MAARPKLPRNRGVFTHFRGVAEEDSQSLLAFGYFRRCENIQAYSSGLA
jgi:hypothetical protein